jgi:hypothetical protein
VKLTMPIHLVPRIGMSGNIPLLPTHVSTYMACTWKYCLFNFLLYLWIIYQNIRLATLGDRMSII